MLLVLLLLVPADRPPAVAHGPLLSALTRVVATPESRVETVVDRFTPLGARLSNETITLAADPDVALLADALDTVGVDQAAFSTDSFRFVHDGAALLQYRALATGAGVRGDGRYMAIAFAEPDHAAAVEQVKRLDKVLHSGQDEAARRPWSDLVAVERLEARGRVVLAVLPTKLDTLWLELERQPDTLLWWSQG